VIAALSLWGCATREDDPNDPPVAFAYGQYLRQSDLRTMIPMDATPQDSAARAGTIIDGWLREQALLHRAEQNLGEADKDFEARLRDYRNDLIIYAYERALIEEKLDTTFTDQEVAAYYEAHQKNFELKDNIVRARWFRVREQDKRTLKKIETWFRSEAQDDQHELELWLAGRGITIHEPQGSAGTGEESGWILFKDLQQEVPLKVEDPVSFLSAQPQQKLVVADSAGTCFVHLLDHRLQSSVSPLAMVAGAIRGVLLEQRKQLLIERMREDLYHDALGKKEIGVQ
jgi:hypothetical protein